jgi:putative transcriptional regulator
MISIRLSTLLGERRWTQADLARATDIRPSTISDLYNDLSDRVGLNQLDLICEALNCRLDELMVHEQNGVLRVTYTRAGFPKKQRRN